MKIGMEVEGRYKGMKAIFCDAMADIHRVREEAYRHKVDLVYVSDNTNRLDYTFIGEFFEDFVVTMDVTRVRGEARPSNLNLMLRVDPFQFVWKGQNEVRDIPNWSFDDVYDLNERDQIKFEQERTVFVFPMMAAIRTIPSDFDGDVEI